MIAIPHLPHLPHLPVFFFLLVWRECNHWKPSGSQSCDSGTFTLATYYSNFLARQLYAQKCLKYRKIQYWRPVLYHYFLSPVCAPQVHVSWVMFVSVNIRMLSFWSSMDSMESWTSADLLIACLTFIRPHHKLSGRSWAFGAGCRSTPPIRSRAKNDRWSRAEWGAIIESSEVLVNFLPAELFNLLH